MSPRTARLTGLVLGLSVPAAAQCELQQLISTDFGVFGPFGQSDAFGTSLDLDGDVLIVGTPFADVIDTQDGGAAYVYRRSGEAFLPEQKLVLAGAQPDDFSGLDVWVQGERASVLGLRGLAEYGFDGNAWVFEGLFVHDTVSVWPVADLDDDLFVVGNSSANDNDGEARVYRRGVSGWALEAVLPNPLAGQHPLFGASVSIDGERVAVGTLESAHVFAQGSGGWELQQTLLAPVPGEAFGERVVLSGDTLAVGASHADVLHPITGAPWNNNGAVYMFTEDGSGDWGSGTQLVPTGTGPSIAVGRVLDLDGDVLAVGSRRSAPYAASGDVTVFHRRDGQWIEDADPVPGDLTFFDVFGSALALQGELLVASSLGHDELPFENVGKAYVFDVHPVLDLGGGLAGQGGLTPVLALTPGLCPGALLDVSLSQARASSTAGLVFGLSAIHAPFKGGVLVPTPDLLVLGLPVDAGGNLAFSLTWPSGFPGIATWWQLAVADVDAPLGWSLSNALSVTSAGF